MESYLDRKVALDSLGFNTYHEYLNSNLWCMIRQSAIDYHGKTCLICNEHYRIIHHLSYTREVLLGMDLNQLVPLCNDCHKRVEFHGKRKRTLQQALRIFRKLIKQTNPPKTKPRIPPGKKRRPVVRSHCSCGNFRKKHLPLCLKCWKNAKQLGKRIAQ